MAYFVLYAFLPRKVYSMLEIQCTSHRIYEMKEVLGNISNESDISLKSELYTPLSEPKCVQKQRMCDH